MVFDDIFVDQNVYSGLAVDSDHRQKLHELILGAQGVALNATLQAAVNRVDEQQRALRAAEQAIPPNIRAGLTVDAFCALVGRDDIDQEIANAERGIAAAREQENVRQTKLLDEIVMPAFDEQAWRDVLGKSLADVDAAAMSKVNEHFARLGRGAEGWVADGMTRIYAENGHDECPFCAQTLDGSPIVAHYRTYFSDSYKELKSVIAAATRDLTARMSADVQATFERSVRALSERLNFWRRFADLNVEALDTAEIVGVWSNLRNIAVGALDDKTGAPLDVKEAPVGFAGALAEYERALARVLAINAQIKQANAAIAIVKERTAAANLAALQADLDRLRAIRTRHAPNISPRCTTYTEAKTAKAAAETERDAAREALDRHRATVFPAYQTAINLYLQRFAAGFRLDQVMSTNTRSGSSCTYSVLIDNHAVAVGAAQAEGTPSFKTALSAGDRNTLALAFFFASLDQDPNKANKIVIIDDPITSLDEHRSLTTIQEMRRLVDQVAQVVVLSHSKPFLCDIWEKADANRRAALEVVRDAIGSSIRAWDVNRECITEHDRRHELMRGYLQRPVANARDVAQAIRPSIETFLRISYPEAYPPSLMLGQFRGICLQRVGSQTPLLSQADITELDNLTEYANRFHHDTNPGGYRTAAINDGELASFVTRALAFTRR